MILARHSLDRHAERLVVDEHKDCPACWRDTALAAVDAAHGLLLRSAGIPEMDANDVVTGQSIDMLLERIHDALDAEELDRRDLDGS